MVQSQNQCTEQRSRHGWSTDKYITRNRGYTRNESRDKEVYLIKQKNQENWKDIGMRRKDKRKSDGSSRPSSETTQAIWALMAL